MLQSFLPLLLMTFLICLFIVLMQFLWRFIDDLVGKGLDVGVIGELFFYAALTMVPMALPLAVLLASLMTFGNLGERFELTALKASGISLLRVMAPLMALMGAIAVGAFFFQNDVLPVAQTKMWTLLYSMRQKSPELEIPEGVFYDQIPGYNLFVQSKDRATGTMHDMMIYDMSRGFENSSIILADSGRMAITADKSHLYLKLWSGEQFENLKDAATAMKNVPYRRESFDLKEIMIRFDSDFNRMDEQGMRSQYVGKNMAELQATIDSVSLKADSVGRVYGKDLKTTPFLSLNYYDNHWDPTTGRQTSEPAREVAVPPRFDLDSVLRGGSSAQALAALNAGLNIAKQRRGEYEFKSYVLLDDDKTIRRHAIELQKKFTLSFACIVFFFIGAPLGAIIRKGGLGMPLVISVLLFIFYYIIDNTGYKLARDGRWVVWQGMWLSSAVLLPLGVVVTYKAVNDSAVFNRDAYVAFFRRVLGLTETRSVAMKELVMEEVDPTRALALARDMGAAAQRFLDAPLKHKRAPLRHLREAVEQAVDHLSNSRDPRVVSLLGELPVLPVTLWALVARRLLRKEARDVARVARQLAELIKTEKQ